MKKYWKVITEVHVVVEAESYQDAINSDKYLHIEDSQHCYELTQDDLPNYDISIDVNQF